MKALFFKGYWRYVLLNNLTWIWWNIA